MKYTMTARCWNDEHKVEFGKYGSVHELTDTEVVDLIILYGRATITQESSTERTIHIENDYD
jgi:hypothetical protein